MSDRYQSHRSIVYLKAIMVGTKAGSRMQVHSTHGTSKLRPSSPLPPLTAVNAVAFLAVSLRPMADEGLVVSSGHCGLHVSARGRIGGRYLRQQLLAEVQEAGLGAVVQTPQCVGVTNAHVQ